MADTFLYERKIGLLIWQTSNYWQSKLRKTLKPYNLSLNEYLILESIFLLKNTNKELSQNKISSFSGIDLSVASVTFKFLEKKNLISRQLKFDNRKKIIEMLLKGENLYKEISPFILTEEKTIFMKLENETLNFTNSLKLLLGKNIRIKANKYK
jgi:DNA-binding MarR family transcriptional regulator|tara:strand:+ start:402 stop:863 length:462 start_codon:yes stop_codon:yes gene_type:complete